MNIDEYYYEKCFKFQNLWQFIIIWPSCLVHDLRKSSIISLCEQSSSSSDPVVGMGLRCKMEEEDEVGRVTGGTQLTTPGAGLVEWAAEAASLQVLSDVDGLQPDSWELDDRYPGVTVFDAASTEVPLGTLQE